MRTRVLKFGGSSFPKLESYREIARYLASRLRTDSERLVVVVSAMSGTTGRIQEAGLAIHPEMSSALTDSLLATGEMTAACLMRAALEAEAVPATHLTGYQLGLLTDSKHTRAAILAADPGPLRRALESHLVVVVAGGQAVDAGGQLTMLGRNSSDLTAVAVAAMLGTGECEIFSDVPGVFTADPYLVPEAKPIAEVPYDAIIALSRAGAKVLHHGAVGYAKRTGVRILCRGTGDGTIGSRIGEGPAPSAVVANGKIALLRYRSRDHRDEAVRRAEALGIVSMAVDEDDAFYLALSRENRGWREVLARLPPDHDVESGRVLLTEMINGVPRYGLVAEPLVKLALRETHARLHPDARARITVFRKERARETDLLLRVS